MYPELMVIPMREELTRAGVVATQTADEVDAALATPGTTMVVVNSICGCAAGKMRPGVRLALQHTTKPDQAITVFAGQDREATATARSSISSSVPPSRPPPPRPSRRSSPALSTTTAPRPRPKHRTVATKRAAEAARFAFPLLIALHL